LFHNLSLSSLSINGLSSLFFFSFEGSILYLRGISGITFLAVEAISYDGSS
jgi:hypothetical protein